MAALNNGITIVAKSVNLVGKKFTLADYQIVNGCQTSNILFRNQASLRDETTVPVKIIEVEDREIVNEIVRATNRQTEVKEEAFTVLSDFHKKLERFLASIEDLPERKIVYERRKRQYSDTTFTSHNIITLTSLTNAFVSCFIEEPVDANDYYGVTIKKHEKRMFIDAHSMWPYLLSARIIKEIEKLCVGSAKRSLWKFRFVIAMLIRRSFGAPPPLSSDASQRKYVEAAINSINDPQRFKELVMDAERAIADAIRKQDKGFDTRNAHQDRKFVSTI